MGRHLGNLFTRRAAFRVAGTAHALHHVIVVLPAPLGLRSCHDCDRATAPPFGSSGGPGVIPSRRVDRGPDGCMRGPGLRHETALRPRPGVGSPEPARDFAGGPPPDISDSGHAAAVAMPPIPPNLPRASVRRRRWGGVPGWRWIHRDGGDPQYRRPAPDHTDVGGGPRQCHAYHARKWTPSDLAW